MFAGAGRGGRRLDAARARDRRELAARLGMRAATIADEDRAAYHAAASIASNFLTTLEGAAERLAATAGVDRGLLAPLVRASVEHWVRLGAGPALTGPIARGDEATVALQRAAVQERTPDLLALFDALLDATRALAGRRDEDAAHDRRGPRARRGRPPRGPQRRRWSRRWARSTAATRR